MSGFENDLSARVTLFEFLIGLANLRQRIDLRDRDLEPSGRNQPGQLPQNVRACGFRAAFRLHAVFLRSGEVDDSVDSVWSDTQTDRQLDVPPAEGVNEGIQFLPDAARIRSSTPSP